MLRFIAEYNGYSWNIETIYYNRSCNARLRIGRIDGDGNYYWELIFEDDAVIRVND